MTRLADTGAVYVSHEAAVTYARARNLGTEEARRQLTELLLDARQNEKDPTLYRYRRRLDDVDISARVQTWNRLAIVTSVNVRELNVGGRRG